MNKQIHLESNYKYLSPAYQNKIQKILSTLNKKDIILDIGCGKGEYHRFLEKSFGIDIKIKDLKNLNKLNHKALHANAEQIPIKENKIQTVICINTLEYIKNLDKSLEEIFRVLQDNGRFIFIVDNVDYPFIYDPINYIKEKLCKNHITFGAWNWKQSRRFKKDELLSKIKKIGFKIEKTEVFNHHLICSLNYPECIFYNKFLPSGYKDAYMIDKNYNKKQKLLPKSVVSFLDKKSKLICNIDNQLFQNSNGANILIVAKKEQR